MWTACAGGSGSAVRREESIQSTSVKITVSRATKALPNITLPGTAALVVAHALEGRVHEHSHDDVVKRQSTSLSASASLQSLHFLCFRVRSPWSHRSCELATWCPRPFSLMSSCLSCAFLSFGDSKFWRGFHTLVREHTDERTFSGHPDATKIAQQNLATFANAALEGPKYTCQLR